MHSKSVNIEIMSHDKADEAFEKLFFTHSFLEFFKPPHPIPSTLRHLRLSLILSK